jgi:hypothetical protein
VKTRIKRGRSHFVDIPSFANPIAEFADKALCNT